MPADQWSHVATTAARWAPTRWVEAHHAFRGAGGRTVQFLELPGWGSRNMTGASMRSRSGTGPSRGRDPGAAPPDVAPIGGGGGPGKAITNSVKTRISRHQARQLPARTPAVVDLAGLVVGSGARPCDGRRTGTVICPRGGHDAAGAARPGGSTGSPMPPSAPNQFVPAAIGWSMSTAGDRCRCHRMMGAEEYVAPWRTGGHSVCGRRDPLGREPGALADEAMTSSTAEMDAGWARRRSTASVSEVCASTRRGGLCPGETPCGNGVFRGAGEHLHRDPGSRACQLEVLNLGC